MIVYNLKTHQKYDGMITDAASVTDFAIFCHAGEVAGLRGIFGWDESTTLETTNLDETVRYTSYDGYDFISLIYADIKGEDVVQREVNIFFAKHYLVLVMPENEGERLSKFAQGLREAVEGAKIRGLPLLYYAIFNRLAANFSETLELLEDDMEGLSEKIAAYAGSDQIENIVQFRKAAYTHKKLIRALSYIGGQILIDENHLLDKTHAPYFRRIDTRLMKLYDFADNLYSLSGELLNIYDSKAAARMNATMNKFTVIALFCGPLTVITGVYGMNFTHMPELEWAYGYPFALAFMATVSLSIYIMLKKNKWL